MLGVVLLAVSAIVGAGSPASAQEAQGQPSVRAALEEYVEVTRAPGVALVTLHGDTVRTEVSGRDGSGRSVNEDTRFRLASLSKAFTAIAVLEQVDAGRLGLDDRVADVLPELAMDDERYRSITIRHLLTHRSGIPRLGGGGFADRPADSAAGVVERLAGARLEFAPGTRTEYSTLGYSVLARVVEVLTGTEFNDYLPREVFAPLGMTSTTSTSRCAARPDELTRGYTVVLAMRVAVPEPPGPCPGNGGVISTATDMGVWLRFQSGDGTSAETGERLLRESSLRAMHDVGDDYGFGWEDTTTDQDAEPFIGHGGTLTTYTSSIEFSPATGTGAVALTNALGAPAVLTHNAINALDGGQQQEVPDMVDIINTVLLALSAVVLLVVGLALWRCPRWAARRRTSPGWSVALRLLPLAVLAALGILIPAVASSVLFGGSLDPSAITIVGVNRVAWGLPMTVVLGLVTFLGFSSALVLRLVRLRQARHTPLS